MPRQLIRLYRHPLSGHCHRVELLLSMLGLPYETIDVDLAAGAQKAPAFLAKSPFGQVPVIEDGEQVVYDSNAILIYLATAYDAEGRWLPRDPAGQAKVQQWLSLAAGQIAFGPAAARLVTIFGAPLDHDRAKRISAALLDVLDRLLEGRSFALGQNPTIADVAGYSYIAHAPEGGVSLDPYPAVRAWLARVTDLPGFVPMPVTETGVLAA